MPANGFETVAAGFGSAEEFGGQSQLGFVVGGGRELAAEPVQPVGGDAARERKFRVRRRQGGQLLTLLLPGGLIPLHEFTLRPELATAGDLSPELEHSRRDLQLVELRKPLDCAAVLPD